ncbi:MAG: circularly permuted type 2 ATP-grasp protein [Methylicorpusculum sp.]|uniref:circularly permuted type 2 ATP-grasp protein n=2 Tax=Methylicorpusculum sp. TaxID=2713644 RepID=UPI00271BF69D|nr:circularly permuted type 2 ATP-grasp protein [Methylicorpusculum sp.]MDO8844219.1 circularly permuted type 2 ATP-grasp protein [Methylicorpusculum sp.]MDO8938845.1 circularly permuted type 2 ATP-grasp protein [Methylicorpusculum sp.]MDP2180113.1 circularly permuted type 2 ATP-grasp protein [Methylicorpusculum sp.]MDP2201544.1 circularly permuted type 2 ATP-grasp protein [Methylicorpusculum sp.]MDP3530666.1 circularly permuted type 2 ATP-grasp protein [Methylicorpusculum sp.]
MSSIWENYKTDNAYDELMFAEYQPRAVSHTLCQYLNTLNREDIDKRKTAAELAILEMGITFTVYSDEGNIDRAWPFDIIPRIIDAREWKIINKGLKQRLTALNCFISDVYDQQTFIKENLIPQEIISSSKNFRKECVGIKPKHNVWANICGTDLVRDKNGVMYVLEDNLRVPSGVSYMLENRIITKRVFPELLQDIEILPIDDYPTQLHEMLCSIAPNPNGKPQIAVLTPGIYNSAYFEHAYLAQQMGAQLVEGSDLIVDDDDCVYMRTIEGHEKVDVIYRRIDDDFLDPEVFRKDSILGVPGLMRAWKAGNVALANAPGAGVADDKVVYAYVPEMIRYYLNEEPILPNVETYLCSNPDHLDYVLKHLAELVVKPANESGGYGMLVGPHATAKEVEAFRKVVIGNPRNYIAQPTLAISTSPTLCKNKLEPRHIDLRPFILQGENTFVTAGGLTRVALKKGSLVVNSSQGGGSKDTWIINMETN